MLYSGADIVLKALKKQGVDTLFGYPGGAVIPLYDALYRMGGFEHIRTAHEQGASHAADGYARATGKVGICIATSGPGATNTVTGIATAYMDSVPMVVITGQVPNVLLGKDSFQEIDITGVTLQITKHNFLVKDVKDLEDIVTEAIHIAKSGRPGPVLIDIPKDVFLNKTKYKDLDERVADVHEDASYDEIQKVIEILESSERPVIYAGGGVGLGEASKALKEFAVKADIPVVNTLMGLGTFPRDHELSLGLVGMHGFPEANLAVINSDLIIAVGARFSDRVTGDKSTFSANSRVVHLDVDETEISKNIKADMFVLGNLNNTLTKLEENVSSEKRVEWKEQINSFKNEELNSFDTDKFVVKNIYNTINSYFPDAVVSTDVGQHQMWTAQYWMFKRSRSFITSGGLGTMGYGLGAAIGVAVADKESLLITGDGSFRMNCNELVTLSKYNIPLTIVLMNNNALGMVRQWQKMFQDKRYAETTNTDDVDYIKLAGAYSIPAKKVTTIEELNEALTNRAKDKPMLIECKIDENEDVLPIVPPGKSISNFILG